MASRRLLKGCFAAVVLALLGSSAYFQARALTRLIACAIGDGPATARLPAKYSAPPRRATAAALLARNAFDSRKGPLVEERAIDQVDTFDDPLAAPPCESPRLFIVSESDDKRWSMAALQGAGELRPHTRRVGDEVERKRIEYIGFNPRQSSPAVWLSSGGALCQTVLFGRKSVEQIEHASERSPAPPPPRPERLRIVPELAAGKLVGVRLFGIQPKGVFAAVGLQNGDRLEAINGIAMNSPEHALSLYSELRSTSDFDLRLARRGRPIALKLHLK